MSSTVAGRTRNSPGMPIPKSPQMSMHGCGVRQLKNVWNDWARRFWVKTMHIVCTPNWWVCRIVRYIAGMRKWRRRESNPRPEAFNHSLYMLVRGLSFAFSNHPSRARKMLAWFKFRATTLPGGRKAGLAYSMTPNPTTVGKQWVDAG
jgi:hypothetical protein